MNIHTCESLAEHSNFTYFSYKQSKSKCWNNIPPATGRDIKTQIQNIVLAITILYALFLFCCFTKYIHIQLTLNTLLFILAPALEYLRGYIFFNALFILYCNILLQ